MVVTSWMSADKVLASLSVKWLPYCEPSLSLHSQYISAHFICYIH